MSLAATLQEGRRAARAGRRAEARRAFRAALRQDPTNESALLWLAYLSDDPRASLAYIARALDAHPRSPRAHAALRWARRRVPPARYPQQQVTPRQRRPALGAVVAVALLLAVALVGWTITAPVVARSVGAVLPATPSPSPTHPATVAPSPPATAGAHAGPARGRGRGPLDRRGPDQAGVDRV